MTEDVGYRMSLRADCPQRHRALITMGALLLMKGAQTCSQLWMAASTRQHGIRRKLRASTNASPLTIKQFKAVNMTPKQRQQCLDEIASQPEPRNFSSLARRRRRWEKKDRRIVLQAFNNPGMLPLLCTLPASFLIHLN